MRETVLRRADSPISPACAYISLFYEFDAAEAARVPGLMTRCRPRGFYEERCRTIF